jgi:hypothetical protein
MLITRTSLLTGITRTCDIPVTDSQIMAWHNGALIQDVMPHLSKLTREFMITGITPSEWPDMKEIEVIGYEPYNAEPLH